MHINEDLKIWKKIYLTLLNNEYIQNILEHFWLTKYHDNLCLQPRCLDLMSESILKTFILSHFPMRRTL